MSQEWVATGDGGLEQRVSLPGRPVALAGSERVSYGTRFEDPRSPGEDIAVLHIHGAYATATVDMPGRLDGPRESTHEFYFRPIRIPFIPNGETPVRIVCHAPDDRFGGIHDTDLVPAEEAVPSVWWGLSMETGAAPFIQNLEVAPEQTGETWNIHVSATVMTDGPTKERLTFSLRPAGQSRGGGTMERASVETERAGQTIVSHTVTVRNPTRWWPREMGDQNRHVLRASLGEQERSVTFGLRDVTFEDEELLVNDVRVPIRGVNLLDADRDDVVRAHDLGANLVRIRGHVPPASVYEACSESGLLVWQDMPLTGPGPFDVERGREIAKELTEHTAGHPSVSLYAVHDEPVTVADGLGAGFLNRLRLRWRAWRAAYDSGPAAEIGAALPEPSFPAVGGPGLGTTAAAYYPGLQYGAPADIDRLLDRYPAAILASYGAPGPDPETDIDLPEEDMGGDESRQRSVLGRVTTTLRCQGVGAIPCCLRDLTADGCGVYTREGDPKPARDLLASVLAPVQAFVITPESSRSPVVVVNDRRHAVEGTLEWSAGDAGGTLELTVEPLDRWESDPISIPGGADAIDLSLTGESVHVSWRQPR